MPDITRPADHLAIGSRVTHANSCRSYGAGEIVEIVASYVRPPSKARVLFDGERCHRLVWIDDLTLVVTPAPIAGSPGVLRLIWPPAQAGEVVAPVVA